VNRRIYTLYALTFRYSYLFTTVAVATSW